MFIYTLLAIELFAICFAFASTIIIDIFFFSSERHQRITTYELSTLKRINTILLGCSYLVVITSLVIIWFLTSLTYEMPSGIMFARILILCVAIITSLSFRRIHLPQLVRNHVHNTHLSDSLLKHSNSIVASCAVSTVSWLYIVMLTVRLYQPYGYQTAPSALVIMLTYIVALLVSIRLLISIKDLVTHVNKRKSLKSK
jgi:hypothetical protein